MIPYVLTAAVIALVELARRPAIRVDFLAFFHVFFGLVYVGTPLALLLSPELSIGIPEITARNYGADPRVGWVSLGGYLCFLTGWSAARVLPVRPFPFTVRPKAARRLTVVGLLLGAVALLGFTSGFGGLSMALLQGAEYRYVDVGSGSNLGRLEALRFLVSSVKLVFYFAAIKFFLEREERAFYGRVLTVAVLLLVMELFIVASRGAAVGTLVATWAAAAIYRRQLVDWRLLLVVPVAVLVIVYGKQFFSALPYMLTGDLEAWRAEFDAVSFARLQGGSWFIDGLLRETLHATTSLQMAITHAGVDQPFLYFRDYVWLPISLLPASLLGLSLAEPPSVSAINTYLHGGDLVASLPPGLLGALWYHAGAVGLAGGLFGYGLLGRVVQRKFLAGGRMTAGEIVCFVFIATSFGGFVTNGDVKVYAFSSASFLLLIGWLTSRHALLWLGRQPGPPTHVRRGGAA